MVIINNRFYKNDFFYSSHWAAGVAKKHSEKVDFMKFLYYYYLFIFALKENQLKLTSELKHHRKLFDVSWLSEVLKYE